MPCPSPCVGICRLRAGTELCEGCDRTLAEIAEWKGATDERRRAILVAVASRRPAVAPSKTGSRFEIGR